MYAYVYGDPVRYTDLLGLDVFLCKQPAFGISRNPIDHHWIKTGTVEAGMGGARGNVPGNESGDMPGDPVKVTNHAGRSAEKGSSCEKVEGVDENKGQCTTSELIGRLIAGVRPINASRLSRTFWTMRVFLEARDEKQESGTALLDYRGLAAGGML